ncbi:MAG: hypothetical protein GY826_00040, partial [Fuerstiella sp.]|nr:hypothetical protein [Fuerstiella sp.]
MDHQTRLTRRETLMAAGQAAGVLAFSGMTLAAEGQSSRTIPAVPGKLAVAWRRRQQDG